MAEVPWQVSGEYMEACSCDSVCPCPTSGLAARPTKGSCDSGLVFRVDRGRYGDTTLGTVVYSTSMTVAGGAMLLLSWYVRHADLAPRTSHEANVLGTWRGAIPPLVFAVSIPIAFIDEALAKVVWIAIWPCNVVLENRYGKDAYAD